VASLLLRVLDCLCATQIIRMLTNLVVLTVLIIGANVRVTSFILVATLSSVLNDRWGSITSTSVTCSRWSSRLESTLIL